MAPIIQVKDLQKNYRIARRHGGFSGALRGLFSKEYTTVRAVDGVSFSIDEGELVGYLGPNGAGKSTTIKILTGLLVPTGGEVTVNGMVPWKHRRSYVGQIGAVFGQRTSLWWDLPVIESLELLPDLYHVPPDLYRRRLDDFRQLLELDPFLNTPVRSLSLGQRMRADLCATFLHEPRLVFLDEPTIGLDVVAKDRIRQFIQHIHEQGRTTILLTTHDLSDVERLCERVMILDQGRLLYDGSLDRLTARFEDRRLLMVTFAEEYSDVSVPGLDSPVREGRKAIYAFDPRRISSSELVEQLLRRFKIADLEVRRPELEDTIRRIYENRLLHDS